METGLRGSYWNPTCHHVGTCFPALTHFLPGGITGSADKWKPFEDHWPSEDSSSRSRQHWHFYGYIALSFSQRLSSISGIAVRVYVCAWPLISVQCTEINTMKVIHCQLCLSFYVSFPASRIIDRSVFLLLLRICFTPSFSVSSLGGRFSVAAARQWCLHTVSIVAPAVSVIDGWLWVRHKLSRLHSPHLRANANVCGWGLGYSDCPVLEIDPTAVPRGWDWVAVSLERMAKGEKNSPHARPQTRAGGGGVGWGCASLGFSSVWNGLHLAACGVNSWQLGAWLQRADPLEQPLSFLARPGLLRASLRLHFNSSSSHVTSRQFSDLAEPKTETVAFKADLLTNSLTRIMPLSFEVEGARQRWPESPMKICRWILF